MATRPGNAPVRVSPGIVRSRHVRSPSPERPSAALPKYRSGSARAAPHRPAEGPADDVDHLVDVAVCLAVLGSRPDAALDVVLEDEDGQRVDGGPQCRRLLEDVDAVFLALNHPR